MRMVHHGRAGSHRGREETRIAPWRRQAGAERCGAQKLPTDGLAALGMSTGDAASQAFSQLKRKPESKFEQLKRKLLETEKAAG